ncbi:MAG TPA: hypothetical protein ENH82_12180 [bacterium]|nr:hypothetical protein [bacterium]
MNEQQLLKLKKEIDDAKSEISELKGTQKQLMKDLKEQWSCASLKEAETAHQKLTNEISKLSTQIEEGVKELNEKYEL